MAGQMASFPGTCKQFQCKREAREERFMKATGIVRRVEDFGRIVIFKEICRTLCIREGRGEQ